MVHFNKWGSQIDRVEVCFLARNSYLDRMSLN